MIFSARLVTVQQSVSCVTNQQIPPILNNLSSLSVKGEAQTHFLKIADISNGKAEKIEGKLLSVCSQSEISLNEAFGFGSDGASVMTGCCSALDVAKGRILGPLPLYQRSK